MIMEIAIDVNKWMASRASVKKRNVNILEFLFHADFLGNLNKSYRDDRDYRFLIKDKKSGANFLELKIYALVLIQFYRPTLLSTYL